MLAGCNEQWGPETPKPLLKQHSTVAIHYNIYISAHDKGQETFLSTMLWIPFVSGTTFRATHVGLSSVAPCALLLCAVLNMYSGTSL